VSVIGWSGSASLLTFQRPTCREEPFLGNIDYRQLLEYRLESQNGWERSKLSGRFARLRPWWSVNSHF
jgi:hypothetical protein